MSRDASAIARARPERSREERRGAAVGVPYREPSTFRAGYVLQDRFRILRFLARGGAGEVYEAFDTELRCPVALKLVRPEVAANESAIERFRREIALARQVTHPNVSRIFDVFRVELPPRHSGDPPVKSLFLTMELLVGESVAGRIHRLGPLSQAQALPLIIDMIEGLKAAHRAGVIHRDLKSANVMLARQGNEIRAVIMDFGLALDRAHDPDDPDPLTNSGVVVGTPNYMAPEQLTGGTITPAVDQYSLGVVLFEILTGQRPFRGENEVSTAVKRLTEPPPSPRSLVPELEPHWDSTILRMLEIEPDRRFEHLDDIVHKLVGTTMPIRLPAGQRAKGRGGVRPAVLFAASGALLIAVALSQAAPELNRRFFQLETLAASQYNHTGRATLTLDGLAPRSVDDSYQWLTPALNGLLAYALHGEGLEVSWIAETEFTDADPLQRRRDLRAPVLTTGGYRLDPALQTVTLDVSLVDDFLPPEQIALEGRLSNLSDLALDTAGALREAAGLPARRQQLAADELLLRVARRELRSGRALSGLRLLEQPAASTSSLARAEYALRLLRIGNTEQATSIARALLGSGAASSESGRLAGAISSLADGNLEQASNQFRQLRELAPDEPLYALRQAATLIELGDPDAALAVLDGAGWAEPPIEADILRAHAENDRLRPDAALAAAERVLSSFTGSVDRTALGRALVQRGRAAAARGRVDAAIHDLSRADELMAMGGAILDRREALRALISLEQQRGNLAAVAQWQQKVADLQTLR